MVRLARLATIAVLTGITALLPIGAAAAHAAPASSTATVASKSTDVQAFASGRVYCTSYSSCYNARREYARHYYHVSSITYIPPGATCPETCGGPAWYFDWWTS